MNSCNWKKGTILLTRINNDIQLKEQCTRYSKTLSKVIGTAKVLHLNNQIIHSNNKIKTTQNIIKSETGGNSIKYDEVYFSNTDKKSNKSVTAEIFNKYFLTIAENSSSNIKGGVNAWETF